MRSVPLCTKYPLENMRLAASGWHNWHNNATYRTVDNDFSACMPGCWKRRIYHVNHGEARWHCARWLRGMHNLWTFFLLANVPVQRDKKIKICILFSRHGCTIDAERAEVIMYVSATAMTVRLYSAPAAATPSGWWSGHRPLMRLWLHNVYSGPLTLLCDRGRWTTCQWRQKQGPWTLLLVNHDIEIDIILDSSK
jgi:hypothetical protein